MWIVNFIKRKHYYSIIGTLKNFIDRTYAKYNKIKNKDFYFIASSADPSNESIDSALEIVKGFLRCIDNVNLKGVVYGMNLNDTGEAKYSDSLKQTYELEKNV